MPKPGFYDRNFNSPTSDRGKPLRKRPGGKRLRIPIKLPREYADFQLENGRQAIEVLGESFFIPDTNSTFFEGNDPLGHASRKHPEKYAPRPVAEAGVAQRGGSTPPPARPPRFDRGLAAGMRNGDIAYRDGATVTARPDPPGGGASKQGFGSQALRWRDKVQGTLAGGNLLADVYEADLRDLADQGVDPALSAPPNQREQGQLTPSTYRAGKYFAASPGKKETMTRELEDRFADHLGMLVGAHQRLRATEEIPDPMTDFKGALGRATSEVVEVVGAGLLGQIPGLSYVLGIPEGVIIKALEDHGIDPSDPDTNLRDAGVLVSNPKFRDAVLVNFPFGRAPEGKTFGEAAGKTGEDNVGPLITDQVKTESIRRIIDKLR